MGLTHNRRLRISSKQTTMSKNVPDETAGQKTATNSGARIPEPVVRRDEGGFMRLGASCQTLFS